MTNESIAQQLETAATLLTLLGENSFKVRAYEKAAEAIEAFEGSIAEAAAAGRLPKIEGVGSSMAALILEYVQSGSIQLVEQLQAQVPAGVVALSRIRGLGPKKLQVLWKEVGIVSVEQLLEACQSGRLAGVKGFGAKVQEGLLQAAEFYLLSRGQLRLNQADELAQALLTSLGACPAVQQAALTGQLRRALPVITRLDVVAATDDSEALHQYLLAAQLPLHHIHHAGEMITAQWGPAAHPIRIYCSPSAAYAGTLFLTSTEGAHAQALHALALKNPPSEEALYAEAGLDYVPPALRENLGELEAARAKQLPQLITPQDIRGVVHAHSTYSDGMCSLREMAEACMQRGYSYLVISDHSQTAAYAGGLTIARVQAQHREIDALNTEYGSSFRIFKSIESDILPDGSLDYPDEVLATFDCVIASIHSGLRMDEATATERLIRAARNPHTHIMGHLTGRLLLARAGYPVHHQAVIEACAEAGTAIEINADCYRLDMDWTWLRYATERGVPISINPDAHSRQAIDYIQYGVRVAQKGWLTAAQCLNTKTAEEFAAWCAAPKKT